LKNEGKWDKLNGLQWQVFLCIAVMVFITTLRHVGALTLAWPCGTYWFLFIVARWEGKGKHYYDAPD